MKQLNFIIGGQELTRTDTLEIVSDAIGQFEAVFTFDEWWNGFTPTAQFTKDGKTIDCLLSNNKCIVPPEALQGGGVFYVNVFSTDGTGDRKTANEVAVPIKTSGYKKDGSHSQDPSPTVYEQLLAKVEEVKDYVDESSVKNGDGVVASPNADFAEVAEWSDGNPNNEDRIGYFVCFDVPTSGIIMRKANADDDVKGITVSNPSFAGNCTKEKFDENGKLLPQYEYVGVIGLVPVHDNGQCVVGERCIPADGGIAAPSPNDKGYQVVERISDDMILVAVEPNGDMVCRLQEQIDKYSKKTYCFNFEKLKNIVLPLNNNPLLTQTVIKDGGNLVYYVIELFVAEIDTKSNSIKMFFDLPIRFTENCVINNAWEFSPMVKNPLVGNYKYNFDRLTDDVSEYITNSTYNLYGNSIMIGDYKLVSLKFYWKLEFANENIRNAFCNEFSPILSATTDFLLEHTDSKMVDCDYIGG